MVEIQYIMVQWANSLSVIKHFRPFWTLILIVPLIHKISLIYSFKSKISRMLKIVNSTQENIKMCFQNSNTFWVQKIITRLEKSLKWVLNYCLRKFWTVRIKIIILLYIFHLIMVILNLRVFLLHLELIQLVQLQQRHHSKWVKTSLQDRFFKIWIKLLEHLMLRTSSI